MKPTLDFWQLLMLFGALQGLFLAFLLFFHPRGNRWANRFLAVLIFLFSLRVLEIVAFWTKYLLVAPHLNGVTWGLPYLFGLFLYFYTRELISEQKGLKWKDGLHFLPFLINQAMLVPYYLLTAAQKSYWLENFVYSENADAIPFSLQRVLPLVVQFAHVFIYVILTLKLLKKHEAEMANGSRALVRLKLNWLRKLTSGFLVFFGLWMLYNFSVMVGFPYHRWIDYSVTYAMTALIYSIGYTAFRRPEIFSGELAIRNGRKYQKSTLTPEQAKLYQKQLLKLMEQEKPFLQNELKMPELAGRLEISVNHLSQIINEKMNLNFFDFINRYRVDEAKRMLSNGSSKSHTLLHVAYSSGFNNKTSFNAAFKKFTGQTPSAFIKSLNPQKS